MCGYPGGELRRAKRVRRKEEVGYKRYTCEALVYREAIERPLKRQRDRWVKELMARRQQIGEPVFGFCR